MIRAVRHFLWYLEYHSTGGRDGPVRRASLSTRAASTGPSARAHEAREAIVRQPRQRSPADEDGPRSPADEHGSEGS